MSRPIAKILFALTAIFFIQGNATAQDSLSTPRDTNKVVAVVMPGRKNNKKSVKKRAAPSTAERSGGNGSDTSYSKPVRTTTTDDNSAPTTSERTGYRDYLHPDIPKSRSQSNVGVGVNGVNTHITPTAIPVGGNATGGSLSSSSTTTTTTTTTTLPNGHKIVSVKKSDTVYIKKTDTVYIKQAQNDTTRSMKMLFAEVGGPGLAISLNYDARFGSERKGLGFRIGAGYFSDSYGNTIFTVPMQINYLLTKDENNFIELGGGTTFLNSTGNNKGKTFIFDKVTGFAGTATIGYRYQPVDHKLNFRIDFVPIFYDEGIIWAGGVSIGYNFK